MSDHLQPPEQDAEVDRHRFYAQVASSLNANTAAMGRAFDAIKSVEEALGAQSGVIGAAMTEQSKVLAEMRTTFRNIVFAIAFISSGVGWYMSRIVTGYDQMAATVDKLDRQAEIRAEAGKQLDGLPQQLSALNNRLNQLDNTVAQMRHEWEDTKRSKK
jgi:DNA repair ATPase RecN